MGINISDIKKLRDITFCGLSDCKKALEESEGDFDKAIQILRKKGLKIANKRCDNETSEGIIIAKVNASCDFGVLITLACETDFVAKTDNYKNLANKIATLAVENKIKDLETLNNTDLEGLTISNKIVELIGQVGEKVTLNYKCFEGEKIGFYNHFSGKLSCLTIFENVSISNFEEVGKTISMQIAANNPVAIDRNSVDEKTLENERSLAEESSKNAKNDEIKAKMINGKLDKFFKENVLLEQQLISDDKKTVEQYLKENNNLKIKSFFRIQLT